MLLYAPITNQSVEFYLNVLHGAVIFAIQQFSCIFAIFNVNIFSKVNIFHSCKIPSVRINQIFFPNKTLYLGCFMITFILIGNNPAKQTKCDIIEYFIGGMALCYITLLSNLNPLTLVILLQW